MKKLPKVAFLLEGSPRQIKPTFDGHKPDFSEKAMSEGGGGKGGMGEHGGGGS